MKKKLFTFNTKTLVAIGLGAALCTLLFMYVKIPTFVPETNIQTANGVFGFFAALFGPIAGSLIALISHALSDAVQYGSVWWSWVIASGICGFLIGIAFKYNNVEDGEFNIKTIISFNGIQIIANIVCWIFIAPILDIVIYAEPVNLVFWQGAVACLTNSISVAVIGTLLLFAYSKTRSKKGSLTKGE